MRPARAARRASRALSLAAAAVCSSAVSWTAAAERKPGSPLEALPANMEVLTRFGERADISPDSRRVAFIRYGGQLSWTREPPA